MPPTKSTTCFPAGEQYTRERKHGRGSKVTKWLAAIIAAFSTNTHLAIDDALATEVKKTTGQQAKWVRDSLGKHLSIESSAQGLKVTSDGYYVNSKNRQSIFILAPGDELRSKDRHSSVTIAFLEAGKDSARFRYEATFDSRSFGKDQIAVDSGEVAIAVEPQAKPKLNELTNELCLKRIKMTLSDSGCEQISCKNDSFMDEQFLSAVFFTGDSQSKTQQYRPRITTMIKTCKTEAAGKETVDRLLKLWKGGRRIQDDYFDDHYFFPVGAYIGQYEMLRKEGVLFIILFNSEAQRTLLQEACRQCLISDRRF